MEKRLNELEKELISKKLGKASCSMPRERTIKTKQIYTVLEKSSGRPLEKPLDHKGQQDISESCDTFSLVTLQLHVEWSTTWGPNE